MSYRKTIAVDVDLCVVDTLGPWLKWYRQQTGVDFKLDCYKHDLSQDMNAQAVVHHTEPCWLFDSYAFWRKADIYDELQPEENSVEVLRALNDLGYDIVFVSLCHPMHEDSKRAFIKKHFPFAVGFISTGDKQFVHYDYFVDDTPANLAKGCKRNPNQHHILYQSIYRKHLNFEPKMPQDQSYAIHRCDTWVGVGNAIYHNFHLHFASLQDD